MVNTPYPLPRQKRESDILVGNGSVGPYGPSLYKIFDIEDVTIWTRPAGALSFSDVSAGCTVVKTNGDQYDTFSVTFWEPIPASTEWYHSAKRVAQRSVAVTRAGSLDAPQLEQELSKQASAQSELRRDVDAIPRFRMGPGFDPIIEARPNEFLGLNITGDKIIGKGTPGQLGAGDMLASNALGELVGLELEARENIDALGYTPQTLSAVEQLQAQANIGPLWFYEVADLLADTILAYVPAAGKVVVAPGKGVMAGGFRYFVAAADAVDHHVMTAAGVKLYVKQTLTGKFNALAFGVKADGVTDDAAKIQRALDVGIAVIFPKGDYKVNSTIVIPNAATIAGVGPSRTNFLSGVIGGSLFVTPAPSVSYLHLHGFSCTGNSLTGVDGNGHAINFIDPSIDSGTHTPQQCLVERVTIIGFRGQDVRDNSATKVTACGVIQVDGLHNTYHKVLVQECGVGFYFYRAQNSRVSDCVADGCDKAALLVMDCENLIATMNDIVNCGDGTTDANWPVPATGASVSSYRNEGFVFEKSKVKTPKGCPLIASVTSQGDIIQRNWLRPESTTDAVGQGVLLDRSSGFRVTDNTFAPTGGVFGRKAQCVTILATSNTGGISGTLARNTFFDVAGGTIEWNVKVMGNAAARTFNALVIEANDFGDNFAVSGASVVEADILLATCTLNELVIANNKFCATTNVTRTACIVQGASVTLNRPKIGPNSFLANGGTITANYSGGITESELTGSIAWDPLNIAAAGTETKVITVTGAALGDLVVACSFSLALGGLKLTAEVTAANTVTAELRNPTGAGIDLGNGTVRVIIRKAN